MEKIKISGTVVYQDLESGFWGIEGDDGQLWRPVNMPEQLKTKGKKVNVVAKFDEEEFSMIMWGEAIKIISFST